MDDQASNTVTVFLRLRPVPNRSKHVHIEKHDGTICFELPRDEAAGYINNQREKYSFIFNGILADDSSQEETFERVCHAPLRDFMAGINATVFAYGQTGSGKTFTITGGPERYADRGLIPRSISKAFDSMAQDSQQLYTLHISYMEIYNHSAFDLLDPSREITELSDLPPVTILEDEDGKYHMRGLSLNRADTAEDALNLLFLGDTNRMIAETPMNMASSRSHCVFTMHLEARRPGESVVRRSKFHLVDLAGSERVGRTGIDGAILTEAKYINASLHFLEQVIIALQGACVPSGEMQAYIDESISTCRFAQRVAMVSNTATVNEETDPALVIKALRQQVRELKDQVKLLQGGEVMRGPLTASERESLTKQVQEYVSDPSPEAQLDLGASMMSINVAFQAFKEICNESSASKAAASSAVSATPQDAANQSVADICHGQSQSPGGSGAVAPNKGVQMLQEENSKLRLQVQQRDNELSILVAMLKKREAVIQAAANSTAVPSRSSSSAASQLPCPDGDTSNSICDPPASKDACLPDDQGNKQESSPEFQSEQAVLFDLNLLSDRNRAFEVFRKSYRRNEAIENSKMELKGHYAKAKALAAEASSVKGEVQAAKAELEQRRLRRSAADIAAGGDGTGSNRDTSKDSEFAAAQSQDSRMAEEIRVKTAQYKKAFDGLRECKQVIEALHGRLENSRQQMGKDFVNWYQKMAQLLPAGPVSGRSDALKVTGLSQPHGSAANGTPTRSTPLAPVPEHQAAAQERAGKSEVALARSAAQIPMSDSWSPVALTATTGPADRSTFVETAERPGGEPQLKTGVAGSSSTGGQAMAAANSTGIAATALTSGAPGHSERFGSGSDAANTSAVVAGGGLKYPPEVLEAAKPYLTGDAVADADILGFYMARHSMMHGGG